MGRSGSTDDELTPSEQHRFQQPPERLRGGDGRRPAAVALVVVAMLALLAWQPWAPDHSATVSNGSPSPAIARSDASPAQTSTAGAVGAPTATPVVGPSPAGPSFYVSILDNQWTVVALVTPYQPASTEEPATPHNRPEPWSQAGPFLVLQQGLIPLATPAERTSERTPVCPPTGVPRDRSAVPLPAGRVAYVGVTIPGSVPRAHVTAAIVGGPTGTLTRATEPVVRLAGMDEGRRYVIPSAGSGGAVLWARTTAGPLPPGTYRFEVASPGTAGNRYLYACVAP